MPLTAEDRARAQELYSSLRSDGTLSPGTRAHDLVASLVKDGILSDLSGGTRYYAEDVTANDSPDPNDRDAKPSERGNFRMGKDTHGFASESQLGYLPTPQAKIAPNSGVLGTLPPLSELTPLQILAMRKSTGSLAGAPNKSLVDRALEPSQLSEQSREVYNQNPDAEGRLIQNLPASIGSLGKAVATVPFSAAYQVGRALRQGVLPDAKSDTGKTLSRSEASQQAWGEVFNTAKGLVGGDNGLAASIAEAAAQYQNSRDKSLDPVTRFYAAEKFKSLKGSIPEGIINDIRDDPAGAVAKAGMVLDSVGTGLHVGGGIIERGAGIGRKALGLDSDLGGLSRPGPIAQAGSAIKAFSEPVTDVAHAAMTLGGSVALPLVKSEIGAAIGGRRLEGLHPIPRPDLSINPGDASTQQAMDLLGITPKEMTGLLPDPSGNWPASFRRQYSGGFNPGDTSDLPRSVNGLPSIPERPGGAYSGSRTPGPIEGQTAQPDMPQQPVDMPATEVIAPETGNVPNEPISAPESPVGSKVGQKQTLDNPVSRLHGQRVYRGVRSDDVDRPLNSQGISYWSTESSKAQAEAIAGKGGTVKSGVITGGKEFDPLNDPTAMEIFNRVKASHPSGEFSSPGSIEWPIAESLIKEAKPYGYNLFRIYEPSVRDWSVAVTDPSLIDTGSTSKPPTALQTFTPNSDAHAPIPHDELQAAGTAVYSQPNRRLITPTRKPIDVHFEVVPADAPITSHNDDFTTNNNALPSLQYRWRDTAANKLQVHGIGANPIPSLLGDNPLTSDGAPIVGPDYQAEAGHGRIMGIRRAYRVNPEGAKTYRDYVTQQAQQMGLEIPKDSNGKTISNPMLVRVRDTPVEDANRGALADEMGQATNNTFSASEQASRDAAVMRQSGILDKINPDAPGGIFGGANQALHNDFVSRVSTEQERNTLADNRTGRLTPAGRRRILNALAAAAFDRPEAVQSLLDAADESKAKTIGAAMVETAPAFAKNKALAAKGEIADADITGNLSDAAALVNYARENFGDVKQDGKKLDPVDAYLQQTNMGLSGDAATDPLTEKLFEVLGKAGREKGKIVDLLNAYNRAWEATKRGGLSEGLGMASDTPPTKEELFDAAYRHVFGREGEEATAAQKATQDLFAEPPARPAPKPEPVPDRPAPAKAVKVRLSDIPESVLNAYRLYKESEPVLKQGDLPSKQESAIMTRRYNVFARAVKEAGLSEPDVLRYLEKQPAERLTPKPAPAMPVEQPKPKEPVTATNLKPSVSASSAYPVLESAIFEQRRSAGFSYADTRKEVGESAINALGEYARSHDKADPIRQWWEAASEEKLLRLAKEWDKAAAGNRETKHFVQSNRDPAPTIPVPASVATASVEAPSLPRTEAIALPVADSPPEPKQAVESPSPTNEGKEIYDRYARRIKEVKADKSIPLHEKGMLEHKEELKMKEEYAAYLDRLPSAYKELKPEDIPEGIKSAYIAYQKSVGSGAKSGPNSKQSIAWDAVVKGISAVDPRMEGREFRNYTNRLGQLYDQGLLGGTPEKTATTEPTPESGPVALKSKLAQKADALMEEGLAELRAITTDVQKKANIPAEAIARYIPAIAKIGSSILLRGIDRFSDWKSELVKALGNTEEELRPHIANIYNESLKLFAAAKGQAFVSAIDPADWPDNIYNQALAFTNSGRTLTEKRGVIKDAQMVKLAQNLGLSYDDMVNIPPVFLHNAEAQAFMRAAVLEGRDRVEKAQAAHALNPTDENFIAFEEAKSRHEVLLAKLSQQASETARALRVHRFVMQAISYKEEKQAAVKEMFPGNTPMPPIDKEQEPATPPKRTITVPEKKTGGRAPNRQSVLDMSALGEDRPKTSAEINKARQVARQQKTLVATFKEEMAKSKPAQDALQSLRDRFTKRLNSSLGPVPLVVESIPELVTLAREAIAAGYRSYSVWRIGMMDALPEEVTDQFHPFAFERSWQEAGGGLASDVRRGSKELAPSQEPIPTIADAVNRGKSYGTDKGVPATVAGAGESDPTVAPKGNRSGILTGGDFATQTKVFLPRQAESDAGALLQTFTPERKGKLPTPTPEIRAKLLNVGGYLFEKGNDYRRYVDWEAKMREVAGAKIPASLLEDTWNKIKPEAIARAAVEHTDREQTIAAISAALGKDQAQKFIERVNKIDERSPNALKEYNTLLKEARRATPADAVLTLRKAGLLSSTRTLVKVAASHAAFLAMEEAKRVPAWMLDAAMSKLAGRERTVGSVDPLAVARSVAKALSKDTRSEANIIFRHGEAGLAERGIKNRFKVGATPDLPPTEFYSGEGGHHGIMDGYINFIYRTHAALYHTLKTYALERALQEHADLQAKNEAKAAGLGGDYAAKRRKELLANPPESLQAKAIYDAEVATFINDNKASQAISTLKFKTNPATRVVTEFLMPFPKVPTNVVFRIGDYAVLPSALEMIGRVGRVVGGKEFTVGAQRKIANAFGRGATGAALIGTGWYLASKGLMTGEDSRYQDKGSIKLFNGKWAEIGGIAPLGNMLSFGASLYFAKHLQDKSWPQAVTEASPGLVAEQPMVSAAQQLAAFKEGKAQGFTGVLGSMAGSALPTILSDASAQFDPVQRRREGILDYLKARTPARLTLKPLLENPSKPESKTNPEVPETNKLFDAFGVHPQRLSQQMDIARQHLTGAERERFGLKHPDISSEQLSVAMKKATKTIGYRTSFKKGATPASIERAAGNIARDAERLKSGSSR